MRKGEPVVKNILKKNQIMITALAIMIAIAGYLNFAGTKLEDDEYLPANASGTVDKSLESIEVENFAATEESEYDLTGLLDLSDEDLAMADSEDGENLNAEIESLDTDVTQLAENYLEDSMELAENETPAEGEIPGEAVFTSGANVATLSEAKLLKEQTRAKNKETLLSIINSTELSDTQKQSAVDSMITLTTITEKETAAEILLEAKGFHDVVVSITDNTVDVVVNALELTDVQRAQIEDIVKRKTEVSAENIIISTVVE